MVDRRTKPIRKQRAARKQGRRKPTAVKQPQSTATAQRLDRAQRLVADMRRDPSLVFTAAARNRGVDPRWVLKHLSSAFRKDSSGRVRAKPSEQRHKTLYIPSASPGVSIPVVTRNRRERLLLGEWMAALNAAGRGDFSRIRKFPKRQVIGGVRLATGPKEVKRILNALAEEESPFEGLYRTLARPSRS